jgi:sulfur carrier protein
MMVTVNGTAREVADGASGLRLLEQLQINAATCVAEVNGKILTAAQFSEYPLRDGDLIELVTIVGGG